MREPQCSWFLGASIREPADTSTIAASSRDCAQRLGRGRGSAGRQLPATDSVRGRKAAEVFAALPTGRLHVVDSLALGAIPEIIERHGRGSASWRWCICHLRLTLGSRKKPRRDSRSRNGARSRPRCSGRGHRARDDPASRRVRCAAIASRRHRAWHEPAPLARGSSGSRCNCCGGDDQPRQRARRSDHRVGCRAVARLALTCAGSVTRHPPTAARIRAIIRESRTGGSCVLAGELDADAIEDALRPIGSVRARDAARDLRHGCR